MREAEPDHGSQGQNIRRVTGSVDAPLTDPGRQQARELKARVGDLQVFTAPNARARETGRIISDGAQDAEWLRPWGLGAFEGRSLDGARDEINRLITEIPDQSPGVSKYSGRPGDTFNEVAARLIGGAKAQDANRKHGDKILNVTSGRAIHIVHAAAKKGFLDLDKQELVKDSEFSKPGDLFRMDADGLTKVPRNRGASSPGIYYAQHGETDWNEGVAASESFVRKLREDDDARHDELEAEISAALGPSIYAQPVTARDSAAFDGSIRQAIDTGAEGITEHLGASPADTESFIAEYLKDGGFTRLTGDLDKTTVDRLASAIADAYDEGGGFDAVVSAIRSEFSDFSAARAKMIAQTELNEAFNQSIFHFGEQSGATMKSWETEPGACIICLANELQGPIPMDEDFESGDDAPTAHPNCNCSLMVHA